MNRVMDMVLFVVLMGIAAILAALAAFYQPPAPPRVSLLALAVACMAAAFFIQRFAAGT